MKNRKTVFVGLILPVLSIGTLSLLVLLSFINNKVNSVIAVDKLILLTALLSPVIYVLGAIVSITALFKSEMKATALIGVILNIAALLIALYFGGAVLVEFKLVV